jgi:hypothetical protein
MPLVYKGPSKLEYGVYIDYSFVLTWSQRAWKQVAYKRIQRGDIYGVTSPTSLQWCTKEAKINGAGNIKYKTKMCEFFLPCIHILLWIKCVNS